MKILKTIKIALLNCLHDSALSETFSKQINKNVLKLLYASYNDIKCDHSIFHALIQFTDVIFHFMLGFYFRIFNHGVT